MLKMKEKNIFFKEKSLFVVLIDILEELPSLFLNFKLKTLGLFLSMSEIIDCLTPYISANCLPINPLSDCSIMFSISANDNIIHFLLEIMVKSKMY